MRWQRRRTLSGGGDQCVTETIKLCQCMLRIGELVQARGNWRFRGRFGIVVAVAGDCQVRQVKRSQIAFEDLALKFACHRHSWRAFFKATETVPSPGNMSAAPSFTLFLHCSVNTPSSDIITRGLPVNLFRRTKVSAWDCAARAFSSNS